MRTTIYVTSMNMKQRSLLQTIIRPLVNSNDIRLGLSTCEIQTTPEIAEVITDQLVGWQWATTLVHRYNRTIERKENKVNDNWLYVEVFSSRDGSEETVLYTDLEGILPASGSVFRFKKVGGEVIVEKLEAISDSGDNQYWSSVPAYYIFSI